MHGECDGRKIDAETQNWLHIRNMLVSGVAAFICYGLSF